MSGKENTTNAMLDQREADHAINNYTRVPNMLVDGYPELHPQDKWLFVCLVRLCGKEGTRYLSLRYIAERTGFSRGPLGGSKDKPGMIQRLHDAGLIHAEIKRRKSTDGNEKNNAQYHITIADTWRLNYDFFHPETCPDSGQEEKKTPKPVLIQDATCPDSGRDIPKPVLIQDATCPESEPIVRLHSKITESNKITESKKERKRSHSSIPSQPPSQESFPEEEKPEEVIELSVEEQAIYDFGRETIFKAKPPKITPTVKEHCAKIAKAGIKTLAQMISLVAFAKQEQRFKTLHLGNLVNALNGWLLTQQFAIDPSSSPPTSKAGIASSSYDDDDYVDDTFYPTREVTHATR